MPGISSYGWLSFWGQVNKTGFPNYGWQRNSGHVRWAAGWRSARNCSIPLYQLMKKEVLSSKVIGTDDTSVKVLDRKLPFARIGRIWPYVGDAHHPMIVYDYTPTGSRAGPAKFLEGYKGYLQAEAYSVYDASFKS